MHIAGYTYRADNHCPTCTISLLEERFHRALSGDPEDALDALALQMGIDRYDEYLFDSGDFPKPVFTSQVTSDDTCGFCGNPLR